MRYGAVTAALLLATLCEFASAAPPQRIASLNLCTDSLLFELADPATIVSVTALSLDPALSYFHERAASYPTNYGRAEEIVGTYPDLILAGQGTAVSTTAVLKRLGYRVVVVPPASSVSEYFERLALVAELLGVGDKAKALMAAFNERLERIKTLPATSPRRAMVYRANGYTPGYESLENDLLERARLRNVARELDIQHGAFVPLEQLIALAPDLLVISKHDSRRPSMAEFLLQHRALRDSGARFGQRIELPDRYWTCAGSFNLEAIERIRRAADG